MVVIVYVMAVHVPRFLYLCVFFSSAVAIHLDGRVLESGRNGTDVVLLSVAYIQQAAVFADDSKLLRRIAYVETRDGLDGDLKGSPSDSEDGRDRGGIWAVRRDTFTNTQTSRDSDIVQKRDQIMLVFGVDWEAVQWSELNKPFYSALAARLVLFTAPQNIPNDTNLTAQAQFWKDHYNVDGSANDFIRKTKHLEGNEDEMDFVVGFPENLRTRDEPQLFITTSEIEPMTFTVETLRGFEHSGHVSRNSTSVIPLDPTYQVSSNSDNNRNKGVRISAGSKHIRVYGQNNYADTLDAFLALPCSRQNVEEYVYYAMSYHGGSSAQLSQLLIVGCEDNTTVTVASQTITLNMMETYLYERDQDLTGTRVVSNNPISLFSGHQCTYVPENVGGCDHLTEQLPNTATWGTRFLTASLAGRNTDDMYRILASQPSTIVTVTCSTQLQSNIYNLSSAGDWETIRIARSEGNHCAIESTKPLLLVQFALGRAIDDFGDPFMMIIPAIEQYDNDYNIFMPHEFSRHFVTVFVTPEYYQPDMIYIDDVSQEGADWAVINCTDTTICGYATYAKLSAGTHRLYHADFNATIGVSVYGFRYKSSYGYPGGLQLFPTASFTFRQQTYSVREDEGILTVTVERYGDTEGHIVALIATHPTEGTANAEDDFSTVIRILEFTSGKKYIDVNISIVNDESIESNETFTIYLTSDVGVNVSPYVQTEVTIIDDDEDDGDGDDDDDEDDGNDNDGGDEIDDDSDDSDEVTSISCDVNPCVNGGSCTQHGNNITCTCPMGYTGDMCEGCLHLSMCGDDESPSTTDSAVLIVISIPIILLLLALAIVIVIIILLRRKKGKKRSVQVDREERIYDMPHFLLDTGNSGDVKYVKPNVAYGKAKISGTGSDDVKYVKPNVAYGKAKISGTGSDDVKYVKPNVAYRKAKSSGTGCDDVKNVKSNVA